MCRCQVSRAALGSARSVGARQRGCTRAHERSTQACGQFKGISFLSFCGGKPFSEEEESIDTARDILTRPLNVTSFVAESQRRSLSLIFSPSVLTRTTKRNRTQLSATHSSTNERGLRLSFRKPNEARRPNDAVECTTPPRP